MTVRDLIGCALSIFICTLSENSRAGVFYTDRAMFEQAAGNLLEEDFDSFPVNASGFGAFSNGQLFGAFSLTSLTFAADVDLFDAPLNDTGLDGTFLVDEMVGGDKQIRPGGQGLANTDADDDDFRIDFVNPVAATGLLILDNRIDAADQPESISFFDAAGNLIATTSLPGNMSGSGGPGFIGLVQDAAEVPISSIEVQEGRALNDDLLFDNVLYTRPIPEPTSHSVAIFAMLGPLWYRRVPRLDC